MRLGVDIFYNISQNNIIMVLKDKNNYMVSIILLFPGCPDGFYKITVLIIAARTVRISGRGEGGGDEITGGCYSMNYSDYVTSPIGSRNPHTKF